MKEHDRRRCLRTFLLPKNHSKRMIFVISNWDVLTNQGRTFVEDVYPGSFYIKPDQRDQKDFDNWDKQVEYHELVVNKYNEEFYGGVIDGNEEIKKENKEVCSEGRNTGSNQGNSDEDRDWETTNS